MTTAKKDAPVMKDVIIICRYCKVEFTWSIRDQEFFKRQGWTTPPKSCRDCRAEKKARAEASPGGRA